METLKCTDCKRDKPLSDFNLLRKSKRGYQYFCIKCTRKVVKKWRKENPEKVKLQRINSIEWRKEWVKGNKKSLRKADVKWVNKNPEKRIAHYIFNNTIKSGFISRADSCSKCGENVNIEGHHPDYLKPLDVIWLCMPCHKELHRKLRAAA